MFQYKPVIIISFLLVFLNLPSTYAQENHAPKLIVNIVIDPLSSDWIKNSKEYLSQGGILKLINEGKSFSSATVGNALASRASSLASISTAAPPSVHGIVGSSWYNRLKREEVFSTEDYLVKTIGESGQLSKNSATHLLSTSIGDQIFTCTGGKVISICLEADAAILAGGHKTNGSYWFDSYTGNWISNKAFIDKTPQWVIDFNNSNNPDHYMSQEWDLILSQDAYKNCNSDDNPYEMGMLGNKISFPYRLRRMSHNVTKGKYEVIKTTPFGNTLTTNFAIASIYNEQLGLDDKPDILYITFTAFNRIIAKYGYESVEFMDALLRLDMEIQHLLYVLSENIGKENLLVVLTATHGSSWNADMAKASGLPAGH